MNPTDPGRPRRRLRARLKLVCLVLLFAGPLAAAFLGYYGAALDFSRRGQSNNAPLISPPAALKPYRNITLSGAPASRDTLGRKWTIVHVIAGRCGAPCKQALYQTRQTRLAAGKDLKRIQRYIVVRDWDAAGPAPGPGTLVGQIRLNHPDAALLKPAPPGADTGLETQVTARLEALDAAAHDAVLVDPLGNMMMLVPLDLEPRLLLKDLKKLLKLSRIG